MAGPLAFARVLLSRAGMALGLRRLVLVPCSRAP
ncbi:hypothetical protein KYG_00055 [Acidovorax sp. NO-1]|nr:hypothetical protein KYG_00055 [Acidovorax sp. NO-1]